MTSNSIKYFLSLQISHCLINSINTLKGSITMHSRFKKVLSFGLALTMVISLPIPKFAATQSSQVKVVSQTKSTSKVEKNRKSAWKTEKKVTSTSQKASFSTPKTSSYSTDRIIVKYKSNSVRATVQNNHKLQVTKKLTLVNADLVKVPSGKDVASFISELKKDKNVLYAQPDYKIYRTSTPNDPSFGQLWGMNNTGQSISGTPGINNIDIDAPAAWDITKGNSNLVVGVIDEGIDYNHPDLQNNIWTNPGEIAGNGIDDDGNGYVDDIHGWDFWNGDNTIYDPTDGDHHGTHVAGTIAATANNNTGVTGVAPNVKVMSLKFLGPEYGYTSDAISAVQYATRMGVKILNNSWGGGSYDQALRDAINASGALFVVAAGNDGMNIDSSPSYPASYDCSNILSVAAIDNQGNLASFSNYGPNTVDVAAPGVNILSTLPNNSYDYYNGTSMATPHVTGAAALLMSRNPNMTPQQAIDVLKSTGKTLPSLQGMISSGKLINVNNALGGSTPPPPANDDEIPGVPIQGIAQDSLDSVYDTDDVYSIYLHAGDTLTASLNGDAGTDFDLYLFSPDSQTVSTSEGIVSYSENEGTSTEQIEYVVPQEGTYYLDVFSFNGSGNYTLKTGNGPGTYEENHPEINYNGSWSTLTSSGYSNGSIKQINSKGFLEFNFVGTDIEWIGTKNSVQGIANVYIDDELVNTPSLYSASVQTQQIIFSRTLPLGLHTIKIEWTGKRDSQGRKTSTNINLDALRVSINEDADNEAPVINELYPTDGSIVLPQFDITGTATDNREVNDVYISYSYNVNGQKITKTQKLATNTLGVNRKASDYYDFDIPVDLIDAGAAYGPVWIEAWAVDATGNESTHLYQTYYYENPNQDTESPYFGTITPNDGENVPTQFNISGTAYDNNEVDYVSYSFWVYNNQTNKKEKLVKTGNIQVAKNKTTNSKATTNKPAYSEYNFNLPVDLTDVPEGPVYFELTAYDVSGNQGFASATYNYYPEDTSRPVIETLEPADGTTVGSQFNITGTASDNNMVSDVLVNYSYNVAGEQVKKTEKIPVKPSDTNSKATDVYNFEIPIDLTEDGAVEGPVSIEAWAVDTAGNESDRVYRNYTYELSDTMAPTIDTLEPADGATVGSQFNITGTASDNKMVSDVMVNYTYNVSGEQVKKTEKIPVKAADTNSKASDVYNFEIPIDLAEDGAAEGPVSIEAWAVDTTGNESDRLYRNYTYELPDNTAPTIDTLEPADRATVGSQFSITGTASDNKMVSDVMVNYTYNVSGEQVKKTEKIPVKTSDTNSKASDVYNFEIPIDLAEDGAIEGPVSIEAWAVDTAGNESNRVYRNYTYELPDTLAPSIDTLEPADGATVGSQFSITGTASDNKIVSDVMVNYTYNVSGEQVKKTEKIPVKASDTNSKASDVYNFEIPIDLAEDGAIEGPVSIEAWAVDTAGNESGRVYRSYSYVIPDITAPVIESIAPSDGATVGSQFNVTGTASDNKAVSDVLVTYSYTSGGQKVNKTQKYPATLLNQKASDVMNFSLPIDLGAVGAVEGSISIEAWAVDASGNESARIHKTYNYQKVKTTIDDINPSIKYVGTWTKVSQTGNYGNTLAQTNQSQASASLTFNGNYIKILAKKGSDRGFADIYIDDKYIQTVDLYSASYLFQANVFEKSLTTGTHTIKMIYKGQKSPSSTGYAITLDGFVVGN
ncbi:subtilisin family serine protease [Neobacillus bataviensis]|uniref:Subtilisin family serine protease n=1 Tax=Neobacillus bataviensis TaxID=220685 RepID=A0A561CG91_9BACI|nr:S8 family serine peptidase [Neobacillus bataviensis]TWD90239.1 subtilisin family serine protease [Neobacillus bataviensis]